MPAREKEAQLQVHEGACARALSQYSATLTRSRDPLRAEVEIIPPSRGGGPKAAAVTRRPSSCFTPFGTFGRARHHRGNGAPCWRTCRRAGLCGSTRGAETRTTATRTDPGRATSRYARARVFRRLMNTLRSVCCFHRIHPSRKFHTPTPEVFLELPARARARAHSPS